MGLLPHLEMRHLQLPKSFPQVKAPVLRMCKHDRWGQDTSFLLQLDTHPKGRVGSSPRELCALAVQEFGHCPSQGASLGWLCEGRAESGMDVESQAGLDMSTHQGYRGDRQSRDSQSHRFAQRMDLRSFV